MKMDEYLEKKKELQEAEQKAEEIKKSLRAKHKEELKEKFDKYNFLHKLKPWTRSDLLLGILMIVLFLVAYGHGGAVDSTDNEGFFSNAFGFLVKDSVDLDVDAVDVSEELEEDTVEEEVSNTEELETEEEETVEEVEEINYNLWAEYNDNKFNSIDTGANNIAYYVIIQNLETFDIKCESSDASVEVGAGEEREIYSRAFESDAGDDNKVVNDHEFVCYDIDKSEDEGTTKKTTVVVNFI